MRHRATACRLVLPLLLAAVCAVTAAAQESYGSVSLSRIRPSGRSAVYLDGRPALERRPDKGPRAWGPVVLTDGRTDARLDNVPLDGRRHFAVVTDYADGREQRLWCWVAADADRVTNYLDVDLWPRVGVTPFRWVIALLTLWVIGMAFIFADSLLEGQDKLWAIGRGATLGLLGPLGLVLYWVSVRRLRS